MTQSPDPWPEVPRRIVKDDPDDARFEPEYEPDYIPPNEGHLMDEYESQYEGPPDW